MSEISYQEAMEFAGMDDEPSDTSWHLDLFSTILSRKHSYHKLVGKKRYVRVKKERRDAK